MRNHIYELAREIGATVVEDPDTENSYADTDLRQITIWPVTDDYSYAIALHELGHLAVPMPDRTVEDAFLLYLLGIPSPATLEGERRAWEWAKSRARKWSADMERAYRESRASYGVEGE